MAFGLCVAAAAAAPPNSAVPPAEAARQPLLKPPAAPAAEPSPESAIAPPAPSPALPSVPPLQSGSDAPAQPLWYPSPGPTAVPHAPLIAPGAVMHPGYECPPFAPQAFSGAPHCCPPNGCRCRSCCERLGSFLCDTVSCDPWSPHRLFTHPPLCPDVVEPDCVFVPNMLGDHFAGPLGLSVLAPPMAMQQFELVIPNPSGGSLAGFSKLAENSSPVPQTRLFTSFSAVNDVSLSTTGVDVERLSPGFEKAFFNGLCSVELRIPFASTLDSGILADGATNTDEVELGNLMLAVKGLLYSSPYGAVSAGLGFSLPTADDVHVNAANGSELVKIENDSVHLMPFLGGVYTPNHRFFAQGFLQFDCDANGNPVFANDQATGLRQIGEIENPTFLYFDVGIGYWLYRTAPRCTGLTMTGVAPVFEMHYNRSLEEADVVSAGGFRVGEFQDDINMLNLSVGATVEFGSVLALTLGYSAPVGGGSDEQYDGMFRISCNRYFAPPRRPIVD
jgi:hypothetical protein